MNEQDQEEYRRTILTAKKVGVGILIIIIFFIGLTIYIK